MENIKRLYQVKEDEVYKGLERQMEAGKNIVFTIPARTGKSAISSYFILETTGSIEKEEARK